MSEYDDLLVTVIRTSRFGRTQTQQMHPYDACRLWDDDVLTGVHWVKARIIWGDVDARQWDLGGMFMEHGVGMWKYGTRV